LRIRSFFKGRSQPRAQLRHALRLRQAGDIWGALTILEELYDKLPSAEIAIELSSLIGTVSKYADVRSAMELGFDNSFYLSTNSDVRAATQDGSTHYLLHGWKEGRNPSPFFDHAFYRSRNPSLEPAEFPLAHFAREGHAAGTPTNAIGNRYWFEPFAPADTQWQALLPARMTDKTEAVVIVPVYQGFKETMTAIYHAVASRGDDNYCLLVVNDKSPDETIDRALQSLADRGLFEYRVSDMNRGFVQTCNHAIEKLSRDLDVVLLNSDAYVFPGWFKRLRAHASDPKVATVTPLSNNATICSYPLPNRNNLLALECSPQLLDAMAATTNKGLSVEAPTGVGFCLYMRRNIIDEIGAFDPDAFKLGYGEENDFCMRALNRGYKNLIAGDVFVFHTGSVSFSAITEENFDKGQQALSGKHPSYFPLVRAHIRADPERYLRRRLDIARLASAMNGATIFVTRKGDDGIDAYLACERQKLRANQGSFFTILVHDDCRASVDTDFGVFVPNLGDIDLRSEFQLLGDLFFKLSPKIIHVNSVAGIDWHWQKKLLELIQHCGSAYKYVGHDYSAVSHCHHLLRPDGIYVPEPTIAERRSWSRMIDHSGSRDICDPDKRLEAYAEFLAHAAVVEVPSHAAKAIFEREFPSINFKVVPHADHLPHTPYAQRRSHDERVRIVVIGALGHHEGIDVLTALATDARNRDLKLDYTLIGHSDSDGLLKECGVSITGRQHSEREALDRIRLVQPDLILIPSIWPETFCSTLSIALKLKIPPVVFDIGAQAERVAPLGWGVSLPIGLAFATHQLSEAILDLDIDELWQARDLEPTLSQRD